jgi:predicted cupin superfamily sugar epimerase
MTAEEVIKKLDLVPLPEEGGFYRETYRDPVSFNGQLGIRNYSTCIYYLITPEEFSALHAVKSTEIFHFYAGSPVEMIQISPQGELKTIFLGREVENGQEPQVIVPPLDLARNETCSRW